MQGCSRSALPTPPSTVVHVALSQLLRERRTGRRLAWLWNDQGVWLSGLSDGAVGRLNAALKSAAGEGWEWVDERDPVAAGGTYLP
jgi:CHASE2 domain-containing sensor protein